MASKNLIFGDCIEEMGKLDANSIDLVVTSPPYDSLRTYAGSLQWNFDVFKQVADQLFRVMKDGGVVVWVVNDSTTDGDESGTSFKQALYFKEIGFKLHDTMIYLKNQLAYPDTTRYYSAFEYMFVFVKGKIKTVNLIRDRKNTTKGKSVHGNERRPDGTMVGRKACLGNITPDVGVRWNWWQIYHVVRGIESAHPATFPLQLAYDHVISWSNEGDTVLDPFLGSGTTGVAAKKLNRKFIGIEISSEYLEMARKRIDAVVLYEDSEW